MKRLCFWASRGGKKKFTSWVLTAHQADNRLLCWPISSHSDWQKPNMPFTLSFKKRKKEKREPKQSGPRGGQRIWLGFQDLFGDRQFYLLEFPLGMRCRKKQYLQTQHSFVRCPMAVKKTRHSAHKMFNVRRRSCCQRPGRECLYKHLNSFDTRQSKLTFNSHYRTKLLEKLLLKLLPLTLLLVLIFKRWRKYLRVFTYINTVLVQWIIINYKWKYT